MIFAEICSRSWFPVYLWEYSEEDWHGGREYINDGQEKNHWSQGSRCRWPRSLQFAISRCQELTTSSRRPFHYLFEIQVLIRLKNASEQKKTTKLYSLIRLHSVHRLLVLEFAILQYCFQSLLFGIMSTNSTSGISSDELAELAQELADTWSTSWVPPIWIIQSL